MPLSSVLDCSPCEPCTQASQRPISTFQASRHCTVTFDTNICFPFSYPPSPCLQPAQTSHQSSLTLFLTICKLIIKAETCTSRLLGSDTPSPHAVKSVVTGLNTAGLDYFTVLPCVARRTSQPSSQSFEVIIALTSTPCRNLLYTSGYRQETITGHVRGCTWSPYKSFNCSIASTT